MMRLGAVGSTVVVLLLLAGCGSADHEAAGAGPAASASSSSATASSSASFTASFTASAAASPSAAATGSAVAPATGTLVSVSLASVRLLPRWTPITKPGDDAQTFKSVPMGIWGDLSVMPFADGSGEATPPNLATAAKAWRDTMSHQGFTTRRMPDVVLDGVPFVHVVGRYKATEQHVYVTVRHGHMVRVGYSLATVMMRTAKAASLFARVLASVRLT